MDTELLAASLLQELRHRLQAGDGELSGLHQQRDAWQAAGRTAARLAADAGACHEDLLGALLGAVDVLQVAPGAGPGERAWAQLQGSREICFRLVDAALEFGAAPAEILASLQTTVAFHLRLEHTEGVDDLGWDLPPDQTR